MEDDDDLRTLDGSATWDDDSLAPSGVNAEDDQFLYEWSIDAVRFVDWKDTRGVAKACAALAKKWPNGEVVDIQDGSDTYIFANTAAAHIREK